MAAMLRWLLRAVSWGHLRLHPLRAVVSIIAIAAGVALGFAVHLINASALAEFSTAVRHATGGADAALIGPRDGFDEAVFETLVADAGVEIASPMLALHTVLVEPARLRGRTLTVLGIDALRAALLAPHLVGEPSPKALASEDQRRFAHLDEGLFLSPHALQTLALAPGDEIALQAAERTVRVRIVGTLPAARAGELLATMDLGFAQWRFDQLGRLTRIDLALAAGERLERLRARLRLPPGVFLQSAEEEGARVSNLSRAYRVNLNVLALVALFTGGFLVYSLQAQAVAARTRELGFLRVAGLTASELRRLLLAESVALGAVGSALGLAFGIGAAAAALRLLGGDLGGGYFPGVQPALLVSPASALLFFALGVAAAALGGWLPARAAGALAPAAALRGGGSFERAQAARPAAVFALLLASGILLALPPLDGIPVAAYAAIAALLVAAIAAKPLLAPLLLVPLARRLDRRASPALWLALQRLAAAPRFAALATAGVVASFALMVAMATMVWSFRTSVDEWLQRVLPADLYARAGPPPQAAAAPAAFFTPADQQAILAHPLVARAEFSTQTRLLLDPARPPVTLIARALDRDDPARTLPLTGAALRGRTVAPPAFISEQVADIHGLRIGDALLLPLAGRHERFIVAGIWRDYARQSGSIVIDLSDYERATGDVRRTDAAIWLAPGARATEVAQQLRERISAAAAEFAEPGEIRAISLRIFDRSFAVTYLLQLAAVAIGITGIAATFSAQAIARAREFGMLRHLGVRRGEILRLLAYEGLLVTALAIVLGLAAGLAVAWVLIAVVNPQSFHWTMDVRLPVAQIALLIVALLVAAALTAAFAGRRATAREAVLAVREDW